MLEEFRTRSDKDWGKHRVHLATPPSSLKWPKDARVASVTALRGIYCFARSGPVLLPQACCLHHPSFWLLHLSSYGNEYQRSIQTNIWVGFSERNSLSFFIFILFFLPSLFVLVISNHINGRAGTKSLFSLKLSWSYLLFLNPDTVILLSL